MITNRGCQRNLIIDAFDFVYGDRSNIGKQCKKIVSTSGTILGFIQSSLSVINATIASIPKQFYDGLKVMKITSILTVPFTIKDLVKNIVKIIDLDTSLKKKALSFLRATINVDKVAKAALIVYEAGKVIKIWSSKTISWLAGFSIFSLVASSIGTFFGIRALVKSALVFHSLRVGVSAITNAEDCQQKAQAMFSLLEKLQVKGFDKVRCIYKIGPEARVDRKLQKLMNRCRDNTYTAKDIKKGEKYLTTLKERAAVIVGLDTFKVAADIISIAGAIFSLFTPLPIVGICFFGCSGTMSMINWGIDTFLLKSNPFDPDQKCLASQYIEKISEGFKSIKSTVRKFALIG